MSSTLSEAYNDDLIPLQHIIPLDFKSLEVVPDSHVWSHSDDVLSDRVLSDEQFFVPVVDLTELDAVDSLGHACQKWGIFQVVNHGIPPSLLEDVESEARRLFSLSHQEKVNVLRSPSGGTGYGTARITPFFSKLMWHEGFTIMGSSLVDHAKVLWPRDYQRFCNIMDKCQKELKTLAHRLLLIILKSLNVSQEEMDWLIMVHDSDADALQLNSYPPCPNPNQAMGLAPHTDSLLLTILHHGWTNGLEIFRDGIGWVAVNPVSGALTVNVGDLLHVFSNAKFPSVKHRACVNRMQHRVSVAYFYGPPADSIVAPFAKLKFPLYRSLTVKEYLSLKSKHLELAMSMIRI